MGKSVSLAAGGYHLMFGDLIFRAPLKEGTKFAAALELEKRVRVI